jgi:hypothetical protein
MAKFDKEKDRALSERAKTARMFHGTLRNGVTVVEGRKAATGETAGTLRRNRKKAPKSV